LGGTLKTLIHELGHELMHAAELPRSKEVAEVEVDSAAYIVCDAIGLDSSGYSFAYVARWKGGSPDLFRRRGTGFWSASRTILGVLAGVRTESVTEGCEDGPMRQMIEVPGSSLDLATVRELIPSAWSAETSVDARRRQRPQGA
jgi:hypothetical protein